MRAIDLPLKSNGLKDQIVLQIPVLLPFALIPFLLGHGGGGGGAPMAAENP